MGNFRNVRGNKCYEIAKALSKKDENQILMDGLKAGKLMIQFVSNSTQMAKQLKSLIRI